MDEVCRRGTHDATYMPNGVHENCVWIWEEDE